MEFCSVSVSRYKDGRVAAKHFRPRIQLRPKDSKAAFIRLAGGDMNQPYRIGRFLDVKTLVWALRSYSAASIAKSFLGTMGVIPPQQKFDLGDKTLGICMQAYYGGRAEIRIRHTPVPVVYTDFTSQYPTANTLPGIVECVDCRQAAGLRRNRRCSEAPEVARARSIVRPEYMARTWFLCTASTRSRCLTCAHDLRRRPDEQPDQHRLESSYV